MVKIKIVKCGELKGDDKLRAADCSFLETYDVDPQIAIDAKAAEN